MQVIGWNCNMAFRKKAYAVLSLTPDLLIVPECECSARRRAVPQDTWQSIRQEIWVGDNPSKGVGVFSCNPELSIQIDEAYDSAIRYVIPIKVQGTVEFTLLAVWAMDDPKDSLRRYISQVWLAVNEYQPLLQKPTLIVGDFNWNVRWDQGRRLYGNLTQVIDFLADYGVTSLYHRYFREPFGQETRPTLYMHRKYERPYHVDYIFASADFTARLHSFQVGEHQEWAHTSDHMPLIAEFTSESQHQQLHKPDRPQMLDRSK